MEYTKYGTRKEKDDKDVEYFKNRKVIKVKELGSHFERKAKIDLSAYKNIFDKFDQHENAIFKFPMSTFLSKEQLIQLAKDFFYRIDSNLYNQVNEFFRVSEDADPLLSDIIFKIEDFEDKGDAGCLRMDTPADETFLQFDLEKIKDTDPEMYAYLKKMSQPRTIMCLHMTRVGNVSDLYVLVHELTHYFILKESKETGVLDETAPHCMERLVDDFLLSLTPEECKKYNFDRQKLEEDVLLRNIATFAIRYHSVKKFNEKSEGNAMEQEHLKYILALIYQSKFIEFNKEQKNKKILELITSIRDNDFNRVNEILGVDWNNKEKRYECIEKPIYDIKKIFETYRKMLINSQEKTVNILEKNEEERV